MPYVKTINEDGVVSDIMAKALDPTLDATILKKSNLVDGFTQTTAGVNALDAAAGKTLNDVFTNYSSINIATLSALNSFHSSIGNDAVRIGYVAAAVTQTLTGTYSVNTNAFGIFRRADIYIDYFITVASKEAYQGRYNTSTGAVSNVKKYVDASVLEKPADQIAAGATKTLTVDFTYNDHRMLYVGASSTSSTTAAAVALRAIAIIRNNAATGVVVGTSLDISMSGTTLTIKNNGTSGVRYVLD